MEEKNPMYQSGFGSYSLMSLLLLMCLQDCFTSKASQENTHIIEEALKNNNSTEKKDIMERLEKLAKEQTDALKDLASLINKENG